MNLMKQMWLAAAATIFSAIGFNSSAAIPSGYYSKCEGKTGQALLDALCQTISSHTTISYDGLWNLYKTSDIDENGKIWDMYSTKRWTPGSEQCGNYSKVGDCYNREHSMPKSWFKDASPMVSDGFHIYPTDGKVNGQRSNYPFGECSGGTTLSSSGSVKALGRLGASTFSGYSGTVFEPDDQYKGDFARSYFYMAACYNDKIANWSSDMLAGNSYPAFKTWAVNLLMKWTRNDEVSQKELDRNEAVYAKQKNRNPFIDHPELAEYIWGDKVGTAWYSTASTSQPAELTQPADGSTINLGYAAVGITRTIQVYVKGKNLTEPLEVFVTGAGYSVTPSTLSASQVNQGCYLTVSCTSPTEGDAEGTLNLLSDGSDDDILADIDLITTVESGLPIFEATNISSSSFLVRWIYLNDNPTYTLDVKQGSSSIPGYPKSVTAATESYEVAGLDPLTTYTFSLSSGSLKSTTRSATTGEAFPEINVLFDGDLQFAAIVGQPSDVAELLLDIENVADEITITVSAPFQVSTDKTNWSTSVILDPEEDRFYMRLLGNDAGSYSTSIVCSAGTYVNDDAEATGTISVVQEAPVFIETFNISDTSSYGPYQDNTTFTGTAASWTLTDAGIGRGTNSGEYHDLKIDGSYSIRFGKNTTSALTMAEDKTGGIGTVTFQTLKWNTDSDVTAVLEYSGDGGSTWTQVGSFTVTTQSSDSSADPESYSFPVNEAGNGRIRFRQTAGKRWLLDNVAITDYVGITAVKDLEYHDWDAFCRAGQLVIENYESDRSFAVYGMDGLTWFNESISAGERSLSLPAGLYIVVSNDFSRRVLIK